MNIITQDRILQYDFAVTAEQVAQDLGLDLSQVVCAQLDGEWVDLSYCIRRDCMYHAVLLSEDEGLRVYRHTCAHILSLAVKTVFPTAKLAKAFVTEDGFACDCEFAAPPTGDALSRIADEMQRIIKADLTVTRQEMSKRKAVSTMLGFGETYKVQLIETSAKNRTVSVYDMGGFVDVSAGPHLAHTGMVRAFMLQSMSEVHWLDDPAQNKLTRIAGVAFATCEQLAQYRQQQLPAVSKTRRKSTRKKINA